MVEALIVALSDGDNPGRRNSAVEALVRCGPETIPALVETLESSDVDVRKLAVDTLAGIGDESARDALNEMLCDPDSNVRAATADALGIIGGAAVPAQLTQLALDGEQDRLVRLSASIATVMLNVVKRKPTHILHVEGTKYKFDESGSIRESVSEGLSKIQRCLSEIDRNESTTGLRVVSLDLRRTRKREELRRWKPDTGEINRMIKAIWKS